MRTTLTSNQPSRPTSDKAPNRNESQADSTITTTVGKATASTTVGTRNGSSAPGGWMGFRARLFSSGGSLIQESVTQYNGGPSFQASIGTSRNAGGSWYSYGVTYGWNGSGYNAHFTFTSPNQTS